MTYIVSDGALNSIHSLYYRLSRGYLLKSQKVGYSAYINKPCWTVILRSFNPRDLLRAFEWHRKQVSLARKESHEDLRKLIDARQLAV